MRIKRSIERLPAHLKPYAVEPVEGFYTPIDHAGWRYIMRVSMDYFKTHAHQKYLDGLVETGISTERIPGIDEIDLCLIPFGWGAIAVSGFIPPGVFMELMSLGILPIAADMRKLENLDYTPSPDIVHESAGHAPIIADKEYAKFLNECGEIARKCILTKKDMDLYDAILNLSNVKEDPRSTEALIADAEKKLKEAVAANNEVSEASKFGRMIWWTVEYGLIGDLKKPKIYGAGLLSSVGESYNCLKDSVKKIPFSIDCINFSYDITEPQPQLFVTPDFETLSRVAKEFSETLAYKKGGVEALEVGKRAEYTVTTELDSGLQISGVIQNYLKDKKGDAAYLQIVGPCQLASEDEELAGHSVTRHAQGFGTPIGKLKGKVKHAVDLTEKDLKSISELEFESGVKVSGKFKSLLKNSKGKTLIVTFIDCTVTLGDKVLFEPAWGEFDMGCGEKVVSVFSGAADRPKYKNKDIDKYKSRIPVSNAVQQNPRLNVLYGKVRALRESGTQKSDLLEHLEPIAHELDEKFSSDWLLRLEIYELVSHSELGLNMKKQLQALALKSKELGDMIQRGLTVLTKL